MNRVENQQQKTRICILGGGFAGLYTALTLVKSRGWQQKNCHITLVDKNDHLLFTPLLYELITGELKPWQIAPTLPKILRKTGISFYQDLVQGVDIRLRQVKLKERGTISYDYLVLGVGRKANGTEIRGVQEYALKFRTLVDTQKLHQKLVALETSGQDQIKVAIVGGGPGGVEVAVKVADRLGIRGQVQLLTRSKEILANFASSTRKSAMKALNKRGVSISWESKITEVTAEKITFLQRGETAEMPTDLVIWATGTKAQDWVTQLACDHNQAGQVIAQPSLQLLHYPEVFALGDVAEILDAGGKRVPDMAQAAYQQGSFAGKNLVRLLDGKKLRRFRYLSLGEMITLGVNDSAITSFGIHLHGSIAHLIRLLVYLERMPTWGHRLQVLSAWVKQWWRGSLTSGKKYRHQHSSTVRSKL